MRKRQKRVYPTQERLKELFSYRDDGLLIWKKSTARRIKIGDVAGMRTFYGYVNIGVEGVSYPAHKLIYLWHFDELPISIDHKDLDRSNNRIENLRAADWGQQQQNTPLKKQNTSGFKGVSWNTKRNLWRAYIGLNGRYIHLGQFSEKEEAARAYNAAAIKLFGEFARINEGLQ